MKINNLKSTRTSGAFTLIEMIGVLAVIAILAALLIPKIFEAINSARINNAVVSYNTIAGNPISSGSLPYSGYDTNVLLVEQLIDKAFQCKVGTNWNVLLSTCENSSTTPSGANKAYALAGNTSTNDTSGTHIIECIIGGVAETDAIEISKRLDGDNLSVASGNADTLGRVKYAAASGGETEIRIYVAHR